jgi:hypothetical protein
MPAFQSDLLASGRKSETVTFTTGLFTASFQPTAIVATAAGNVVGKLLEDSTDRTYGVTAGVNPLRFKTITESGTTATGLIVVRG